MSFLRVHHFEILLLRILRQSLPILAFRIFPAYGRVVIPAGYPFKTAFDANKVYRLRSLRGGDGSDAS
jgi:hypothetical protein